MNFFERRKNEWTKAKRGLRSLLARPAQRQFVRSLLQDRVERLIVFFVPAIDESNGGVISIASLAAYSRKTCSQAAVVTASLPGDPTRLMNPTFPNDERIVTLAALAVCPVPRRAILHVPEMCADDFYGKLSSAERRWLAEIPELQINILNQNIQYMRPPEAWQDLRKLTKNITQTTAHARYTTQEICDRFGIPTHRFGVYADRSRWPKVPFAEKEKLIVISPDSNVWRDRVLGMLARDLPDYRVREVNDMTFTEYLDLIARARYVLTFGEGFDGYFCQPAYTGTVGVAVYNDEFFPNAEWLALDNVYGSYAELVERFADDVRRTEEDAGRYYAIVERHVALRSLGVELTETQYLNNLRRFYAGDYDFRPKGVEV